MISVTQALEIVKAHTPRARSCSLSLNQALGYVLAEDVYADTLIPPFNRATMDGYAFCSRDVSAANTVLKVIGESAAGRRFGGAVGSQQAVRIMTGAPVPQGADCVQMVEKTSSMGEEVVILEPAEIGKNIAPAGSEVGSTDKLAAGRYLGPAEIAALAAFGADTVSVFRPPSVALLVSGDELVEVTARPGPDQIRNSNAHSLMAQLRSCRTEPVYLGIARDEKGPLRGKLQEALRHDMAIVTGGVSVGQYDLVAGILEELGASIHFDRVSIRPGKPLTFATCGRTLFFGLPGNPVSSLVTFEIFVRPVLACLMGKRRSLSEITATLKTAFLNRGPRDYYAPAHTRWNVEHFETKVLKTRGSADIFRFSSADSLAILPADSHLQPGAMLRVLLLSDYLERINV